jgi:sec-independent protein translocase protein TatB
MELMLVCVVALLVIGPDKLPGAIRTGSLWLGRFRRSYNKVKSEIERELNTDEIKRQLHNEAVLEDIEEAKAHVKKIADETQLSVDSLVTSSNFDPRRLKRNRVSGRARSRKPSGQKNQAAHRA